jgi:two-component system LytT family response regulator
MSMDEPLRALIVDDEPLARERLAEALAELPGWTVAGERGDGESAVRAIAELRPDLVLLDVQMPGLDGFEVVAAVGPEHMPPVVFVTAHDQYALRAFEVAALDYLTKPWDRLRLAQALERARAERALREGARLAERLGALLAARRGEAPERVAIHSRGRVLLVALDELERVEAAGNYLRLYVGDEEHLVRDTLEAFARRLGAGRFVRAHRSHLVRVDAVRELAPDGEGGHALRLRSGGSLPVGPSHLAAVLAALGVEP